MGYASCISNSRRSSSSSASRENPGDLKYALERLNNFHASKLLRPTGIRSCRQEAQGITIMEPCESQRRNSIDGSRQPSWMQEFINQGGPSQPGTSVETSPSSSAKRVSEIQLVNSPCTSTASFNMMAPSGDATALIYPRLFFALSAAHVAARVFDVVSHSLKLS